MTKKQRKRTVIFSIIATVILLMVFSFDRILEGIVKQELSRQLRNPSNSLYEFRFNKLKLGVLSGNLKITDLEITPSDSATELLESGQIKSLIQTEAQLFEVRGFKYLKLIRDKTIQIGTVRLSGIRMEYRINPDVQKVKKDNTSTLHELFSDQFQEADVESIQILAENIHFKYLHDSVAFFGIDSVSLEIEDILANQETLEESIPVIFNNILLSSGQFSLNSLEHYRISTSDMELDVQDSKLVIHGFELIPKHSREEFNKIITYNDDLFSIRTKSIVLNNIDLDDFGSRDLVHLHSLTVEEPEIEIYRDKRLPDAPFRYKPLLAGAIHNIPLEMQVDSLLIKNGRLTYEEQTDASDSPGKVFFDPFYLSAYNITNDSATISENPEFQIDFQGNLMASARLKSNLDIDLASSNENFNIQGSLDPVSGEVFNPMIENLLPVTIQSGDVSRTEFYISATDHTSTGQLVFEYDNLKVDVQKKDHADKKARLISFVANGFVKGKNLPDHGNYRKGTIRFDRRKDRGIVNYLWNSVKTGIISVVAPIADPNKKYEKELKKEDREERRNERKNDKD